MRRTNLLKTIACLAMILVVTGSTIMAGTVSDSQKVRNVATYTNCYSSSTANYVAASDGTNARTSVQSKSATSKWFGCYVHRYNYNKDAYDKHASNGKALTNGDVMKATMARNKTSYVYDYVHVAQACYTTGYLSSTVIDNFKFTAMQYYR